MDLNPPTKIIEYYEVFLPPEQSGQRRVTRGRFTTKANADVFRDFLNERQHPDAQRFVAARIEQPLWESAQEAIAFFSHSEREAALAKLTEREKHLLGLDTDNHP